MVAMGARRQPAPASGVFFARHRGGLSACYPTALLRTCAGKLEEVVFHSDHGTQYTALAVAACCDQADILRSMGTVGDC